MSQVVLRKTLVGAVATAAFATAIGHMVPATASDPGVFPDRIVLGQSAAFDGPARALGQGMRLGLLAAFNEVNKSGGINGRMIELVTYDDGYEPEKAIANTNRLIGQDGVFALIGAVGTSTSNAAQPIATAAGVPFIGPFTGAGALRDPALRNVVNVRAPFDQETEAWIKHLTEDLGYTRIAILYQDDAFGRIGFSGVEKAMKRRNLDLVAQGTYKPNTTAVRAALLSIRKGDPEAVVMVGAHKPISVFIKSARKLRMDATFVNISSVGSEALAGELGADGIGVVVTQTVPLPTDTSVGLVKQYQAVLAAYDSSARPDFVSLEGYIVGRFFAMALHRAGAEPTRESLLSAIYDTGSFDLGGVTLRYGAGDNQGMDEIYLTVIENGGGRFRAVERLSLGS